MTEAIRGARSGVFNKCVVITDPYLEHRISIEPARAEGDMLTSVTLIQTCGIGGGPGCLEAVDTWPLLAVWAK